MVPVVGVLLFALLFTVFPLITRGGPSNRSCHMCGLKRRLGMCDGDSCSSLGPRRDDDASPRPGAS